MENLHINQLIHIFSPLTGQPLNSFNTMEEAVVYAKISLRNATRVNLPVTNFSIEIGTFVKKLKKVTINTAGEITIYSLTDNL